MIAMDGADIPESWCLSAMFAGKRCITPGWINYLFSFGATCVPSVVVRMIKRKAKFYQYGK